jgi:hypothetical protein
MFVASCRSFSATRRGRLACGYGGRHLRQLEQRRHAVTGKLDRGYEDYVEGRISEDFWTRKSQEWELELQTVWAEQARLELPGL